MRGHGLCQACYYMQPEQVAKRKVYQQNNKDAINALHVLRETELREAALIRLGYKCNYPGCTWTDPRAFQIDHINGNGREDRKKFKHPGMYLKIIKMEHPELEYQILCANHNTIKKFECKEFTQKNEGTVLALKERFQRDLERDSRRQLVQRVDDSLAGIRATLELHSIRSNGGNGRGAWSAGMDEHGRSHTIPSIEPIINRAIGVRKKHCASGYSNSEFDNAPPGWAEQADGFDWSRHERSSPPRSNDQSTLNNNDI